MSHNNNDKMKGFLTGFIAGGIVGGILALLYAPMSGKKLRRRIGQTKDELVEDVSEYYEAGKEKAGEIIKEGKKKAETIVNEAKKIVSN